MIGIGVYIYIKKSYGKRIEKGASRVDYVLNL